MHEVIAIPCPKCGSTLRLRNRKLLGRKGKCPKCQHRFLLEQTNVPSDSGEQTTSSQKASRSKANQPTDRPNWMPGSSDSTTQLAESPSTVSSSEPKQPALQQEEIFVPLKETSSKPETNSPQDEFSELTGLNTTATQAGGASRLQELKRKQKKQRNLVLAIGSIICVAVVIIALIVSGQQEKLNQDQQKREVQQNVAWEQQKDILHNQVKVENKSLPTDGKPISLRFLPAGCRLLIHLHPGYFWKDGSLGQEFRYCFGEDFNNWFSDELKKLALFDMQDIDRMLVGVILGPRGTPPDYCAVVHMKADYQRRDYIRAFGGALSSTYSQYKVYENGGRAFLLVEKEKVFVNTPVSMIGEAIESMKYPHPTSIGVEELIKQTDQDRHLTMMIEPNDALIHTKTLIPELGQPAWKQLFEWIGTNVETVAFTVHLSDGYHSQLLLRNQYKRKEELLYQDIEHKIKHLPQSMLSLVKKMNPRQSGPRKVIGRYPAMLKAFSMATTGGTGNRFVQFTTSLPERAAPNLAIGTVLAWDESTRTDFSLKTDSQATQTPQSNLPKTVIGRLRQKLKSIFVEPLYSKPLNILQKRRKRKYLLMAMP